MLQISNESHSHTSCAHLRRWWVWWPLLASLHTRFTLAQPLCDCDAGVQKKAQRAADAAAKAARCCPSHLLLWSAAVDTSSITASSLHWSCHTSPIPISCCFVYLWAPCRRHLHWLRFAAMLDVQARSFHRGFVKWPLLLARIGLGSSSHRGWSIQEEWKHPLVRDRKDWAKLEHCSVCFRGSRFHSHGIFYLVTTNRSPVGGRQVSCQSRAQGAIWADLKVEVFLQSLTNLAVEN